jgi:hypothetical protein
MNTEWLFEILSRSLSNMLLTLLSVLSFSLQTQYGILIFFIFINDMNKDDDSSAREMREREIGTIRGTFVESISGVSG